MPPKKTAKPTESIPSWVQWIKNVAIGKEDTPEADTLSNIDLMDVEPVSTSILLGGNSEARSRQQIYAKYQQMQQNSFIVIKESLLNTIESVLSQINLLLEIYLF